MADIWEVLGLEDVWWCSLWLAVDGVCSGGSLRVLFPWGVADPWGCSFWRVVGGALDGGWLGVRVR
eukprot:1110328-Pyramimonas_sp.AAC.1